ncbi:hypothetical protein RRG08_004452 [Elysia crispata]|uniref:Uncharacterized protein n=1 Tax=Elysia crispata TaxID=231223 RepID=A0AAE1AYM3_9GAST|nr:hypothetical protein RRG08_004452 [Elysia crispata]
MPMSYLHRNQTLWPKERPTKDRIIHKVKLTLPPILACRGLNCLRLAVKRVRFDTNCWSACSSISGLKSVFTRVGKKKFINPVAVGQSVLWQTDVTFW